MLTADMPPRTTQRRKFDNKDGISKEKLHKAKISKIQIETPIFNKSTRRVRNFKPSTTENTSQAPKVQSEKNNSLDPEDACYVRNMMEDWNKVILKNRKLKN